MTIGGRFINRMRRCCRHAAALGWMASLTMAPGCAHFPPVSAVGGATLARPSIVDVHGSLPMDAGMGGLAGVRATVGLGSVWALDAGLLVSHERFASAELPTDSQVRLTSLAVPVLVALMPRRQGRLQLVAGLRPAFPMRARRQLRDDDQDVIADYRPASLALALGAGAWLDADRRLLVELRYVAGITNLDATHWYESRQRSLEFALSYRVSRRSGRP